MRPALVRMLIATIAVLALPATTLHATAAAESAVTVSISEVDLDGPAVSPVTVTVENNGPQSMSELASFAATGTVTVWYTDGTTTTGTIGFPNWSFQEADAHGATLVISMDGRHTPDGYANSEFQYRVFGHSIALDPTKTVEMVTLPGTGSLHIFDVAFVS